jgi:hypothetical protein
VATSSAIERALDAMPSSAALVRAHVYFEVADKDALELAVDLLLEEGFELVRPAGKRYEYHEREWTWAAEVASDGVGVYVRSPM